MHMYRAYDEKTSKQLNENFYHWWIVTKDNEIIDLTSSQYSENDVQKLHRLGKKSNLLGFDYKKRVQTLYDRVIKELMI